MSEIEALVQRAIGGVTAIATKAARFASRLALVSVVIVTTSFLLGLAALSGGIKTVWIALGIVFGAIAIGGSIVARWRVGSVRRHVPELADEMRSLLSEGRKGTRTVIESFVVESEDNEHVIDTSADGVPNDADGASAIAMSRQMYGFKNAVDSGLENSARLTAALTALTSFPGLVLGAIAICMVFGFLGAIFLIALAL